jgi:hypothetical protein
MRNERLYMMISASAGYPPLCVGRAEQERRLDAVNGMPLGIDYLSVNEEWAARQRSADDAEGDGTRDLQ